MTKETGFINNAMLVSLTISRWYNTITDQEITNIVATNNKAKNFAIRVNKQLLAKRGAVVKVQAALTALRSYHNTMTLPWGKGIGIIKSSKYTEYSGKIRQLISEVNICGPGAHNRISGLKNWMLKIICSGISIKNRIIPK